jgi:hypothetical protein
MRIYPFIIVSLLLSCKSSQSDDTPLAHVGDEILFQSEVMEQMPKDISSSDSAQFCESFIQQWIQEQAMKMEAEKLPEPSDMNVKIDRYKNQLLIQALREKIISERISENQTVKIDSAVTGMSVAAQQENKKWLIWQQYQDELIKKYEAEGLIKKP